MRWGQWVAIMVHVGQHQGHEYVRMRRWNRHRKKDRWYPTRRYFAIPVDHAEGLADVLRAAAHGEPLGNEPDWLDEFREEYAAYTSAKVSSADAEGASETEGTG